jgi:hypothetical protein
MIDDDTYGRLTSSRIEKIISGYGTGAAGGVRDNGH